MSNHPLTAAQVAEIQRRCDAAKEFVGNCDGYGCVEDNVIACVIDSIPALLRDRAALVAERHRLSASIINLATSGTNDTGRYETVAEMTVGTLRKSLHDAEAEVERLRDELAQHEAARAAGG